MTAKTNTNQRIVLTFAPERETKSTWRFAEQHDDTDEPVIGTLYVPKSALARLGKPDALKVTIEAQG